MKATFTLLSATLVASLGLASAETKPNVVVEPFLASWCAKQFPDELKEFSGYSMVNMLDKEKHVKIEPFVGGWCFEQFPQQLQALDQIQAIDQLHTNHKQLEPFLEAWGRRSLESDRDLIGIEPYIGAWCLEQYPSQLGYLQPTIYLDLIESHVKFEPALARWCFAQFPDELNSLDQDSTVQSINSKHELVENELIKWTLTTNSAIGVASHGSISSVNDGAKVAIIILSALLALSWAALFWVIRRQSIYGKEADTMQAEGVPAAAGQESDTSFA